MAIYSIEQAGDEIKIGYTDGEGICELRGGNALFVAAVFANLHLKSEQRADDFIAGVVAGLNHCAFTGRPVTVTWIAGMDEYG